MANRKGDVMNNTKKLAVAVLAVAALSGCVTTRVAEEAGPAAANPAAVEKTMVSVPMKSYGSMGGYRYRRWAAVAVPAS
jgi:hypothetical protein